MYIIEYAAHKALSPTYPPKVLPNVGKEFRTQVRRRTFYIR